MLRGLVALVACTLVAGVLAELTQTSKTVEYLKKEYEVLSKSRGKRSIAERSAVQKQIEYLSSFQFTLAATDTEEMRIRKMLFSNAQTSKKPTVTFLGGGSAVGKSFSKPYLVESGLVSKNHVNLDIDEVMMNLDAWEVIANKTMCASQQLHYRAKNMSTKLFEEATKNRFNIVYDSTLSNVGILDTMKQLNAAGYVTHLVGFSKDIPTCAEVALDRAKKTNRYVPLSVIRNSHVGFSKYFTEFASVVNGKVVLFDRDTTKLEEIVSGNNIKSWATFSRFMNKRDYTADLLEKAIKPETKEVYDKIDILCATF
jgi:predicted ABC-type ATPase